MKLNLIDKFYVILCGAAVILLVPELLDKVPETPPAVFGIRFEFVLFGLTLLGVALYHHKTLQVALSGLGSITLYKLFVAGGFDLIAHVQHEASILTNLLGLLLGFAILSKHFEESRVPDILPSWLPPGWLGGFVLLFLVWIMSAFLDNIAAAMIGGTIALVVFKKKVHIGFLAAIVAASNAGGAGSVVGDTTTTMMWIDGVSALDVTHAFLAAAVALLSFGFIAAKQQFAYQPIVQSDVSAIRIDWTKILVVVLILAGAITTNVMLDFPAAGVWAAILIGALFTKTDWNELPHALKGSIFLLSLVICASMMPVEELPPASWQTAFALGFASSVFDNIPLTKLALQQGGYDWGVLAYTVGFGGSMVWFGSSAGVAVSNIFPEAKSVGLWLKHGWHIAVAYVIGFFALLWTLGWEPHERHKIDAPKEHSQVIMLR
jgi:Na+/H+ antiporter NhaD/arsenite permease-like protein